MTPRAAASGILLVLLMACAPPSPPPPLPPADVLLSRFAYSPTPAEVARVEEEGVAAWLQRQLSPPATLEPSVEPLLAHLPVHGRTAPELYRWCFENLSTGDRDRFLDMYPVHEMLARQRLLVAARTEWPLRERMVDFWINHFSVDAAKSHVVAVAFPDLEAALRARALGRFRDLLGAVAASPAMLDYLDNVKSNANVPQGINENYGRELLELHTVGVSAGYSQEDVEAAARTLTGWSLVEDRAPGSNPQAAPPPGPDTYTFQFAAFQHDGTPKTVMGLEIPPAGQQEGERLLDFLARQPATARFVCRKLARRFVADEPPEALVEELARTFLETEGDMRAVVRALAASAALRDPAHRGTKVTNLFEFTTGALRRALPPGHPAWEELGRQVLPGQGEGPAPELDEVVTTLVEAGLPCFWKSPAGWDDVAEAWSSTAEITLRTDLAGALAARAARPPGPGLPAEVRPEDFLPGPISPATREGALRLQGEDRLAFLLASPEFQLR